VVSVGRDDASPVTDEYPANENDFPGTIKWVRLDTGADDHSHMVEAERVVNYAMARQ